MKCPFCGNSDTNVKDSRPTEDNAVIRRRRECPECKSRFTTFERIQLKDIIVIKRNNVRTIFVRDKVRSSIKIATRKRPVTEDDIDNIMSNITLKLEERGDRQASIEVTTKEIGEMIMSELAEIDKVSYIRFASVYKDFAREEDFAEFIEAIK